jgi:5'-deoxynucleotidase YfbR-like HD superfamily hydrolase
MSNFNKIYDHINKLSNVYRFAGKRVDSQYNVAEHSYRVAVLAMLVVDQYNKENSIQIDKAEVLSKALLHDIEEGVFNDIPAPAKNYNKSFKEIYKETTHQYVINEIFPSNKEYYKLWANDKSGLSGEIINLCDKLEAIIVSADEVRRGQHDMRAAYKGIKRWFESDKGIELLAKYTAARYLYMTHSNLNRPKVEADNAYPEEL